MKLKLRLPALSDRTGRFVIGLLLFIKLVLLAWNAVSYDGRTHDPLRHSDRALSAGLEPGKLAYDPPLYYLPLALVERPSDVPLIKRSAAEASEDAERDKQSKSERAFRGQLLDYLRYSNVLWIGLFYVAWIGFAFPRLLGHGQRWFLASLLLLAIPGFQKLAAMSHPDNAFVGTLALAVSAWLWLRERWLAGKPSGTGQLALFALTLGVLGLTRPTALVPVAVLTVVALVYCARFSRGDSKRLLARAAMVLLLVGGLSGSWHVLCWQRSGVALRAQSDDVVAQFQPRKAGFSYARYYTSLHPLELLETPNQDMGDGSAGAEHDSPYANSFVTLLYSEVWGDHWLSFSGPKQKEAKLWPKRLVLAVALLTPLLALALYARWFQGLVRDGKRAWQSSGEPWRARLALLCSKLETDLVLGALATLTAVVFVCWQAGPGLMPGHNATIKFAYFATFFAPALALMFSRPLGHVAGWLLSAYLLLVFSAAFPFAMYWPS